MGKRARRCLARGFFDGSDRDAGNVVRGVGGAGGRGRFGGVQGQQGLPDADAELGEGAGPAAARGDGRAGEADVAAELGDEMRDSAGGSGGMGQGRDAGVRGDLRGRDGDALSRHG